MKLYSITLLLAMFASSWAHATDNLYSVISGGYTDTEFSDNSAEGGTYKIAVGYQFHRQWYAEFGYQKLSDQSDLTVMPASLAETDNVEFGLQGDALFAALLGKANGSLGELFYRVGVLNVDMSGQQAGSDQGCSLGDSSEVMLQSGEAWTLCSYDEGSIAGVFGIGFDFYISSRAMLRAEIEHISGEHDLSVNAAYVGLRYNF